MATWAEMIADIYTLTSRPDLVAETEIALRQAVRLAHKSAKYWRDLKTVTVTVPVSQIQAITIPDWAPRFRAVGTITSASNSQIEFDPVMIDDLLDQDGYSRTNVYWGIGTELQLRAANPESSYVLTYYQYPVVTPVAQFSTWIADEHSDLLTMLAAVTVLGTVGEQEIRGRLEVLAAAELSALRNSNIEAVGR